MSDVPKKTNNLQDKLINSQKKKKINNFNNITFNINIITTIDNIINDLSMCPQLSGNIPNSTITTNNNAVKYNLFKNNNNKHII